MQYFAKNEFSLTQPQLAASCYLRQGKPVTHKSINSFPISTTAWRETKHIETKAPNFSHARRSPA
jgi:hypothetical protein